MKRIQLIALDLDQTTLRSDKTLSERTIRTLEEAADAGLLPVIASGRSFASLPKAVFEVRGIRYAITSNGAAVYDMKTGERCLEYLLQPESVERILEVLPGYRVMEAFIRGVPYAWKEYAEDAEKYGVPACGAEYVRATRKPVEDIRGFIRAHAHELDSLDVITRTPEELPLVRQRIREAVDGIYMTSSAKNLLEISDARAGKHSALAWLARELEVSAECVAAFGDAENDRDMIRWAGLGVAMGNAAEAVKAVADRVTAGNDEDGVALVLQEILREKRR